MHSHLPPLVVLFLVYLGRYPDLRLLLQRRQQQREVHPRLQVQPQPGSPTRTLFWLSLTTLTTVNSVLAAVGQPCSLLPMPTLPLQRLLATMRNATARLETTVRISS